MAVCFRVDLSVCVSLQEAELAARILLDQGQVTAWGSPRVGGGALLSLRKERPSHYLTLLSASFYSCPFLSPSLPFPSLFAFQSSLMLSNLSLFFSTLKNHLPLSYLPKLNYC